MGGRHKSATVGPALHLGPALCVLALAGCEAMMGRPGFDGDPITGGGQAIPRAPANSPPPAVAATPQPNPLPALPAPASSTSPAALTGGANPSLDPNRDLRIGTGPGYAAQPPAGGTAPTASPTGAVLRTPQPLNETSLQQAGSLQPPVAATVPTAAGGTDTYQQLQAALTARGVTWRRLETVGDSGEWRFLCSVPSTQNPNIRRNYEGHGASDLAAIRAVLDQIDRERLK